MSKDSRSVAGQSPKGSWRQRVLAERIPLECRIRPGMFPEEYIVALRVGETGYATEAHLDFLSVEAPPSGNEEAAAFLWVRVLRPSENGYLVELPEPTFTSGELIEIPTEIYNKAVEARRSLVS